jgi:hypothetical protein
MFWRKNLHRSFVRLLLNHFRKSLLLFLCKPQSSLLLQVLQHRSGELVTNRHAHKRLLHRAREEKLSVLERIVG